MVYNIVASFSDHTNPPVQYSIYVGNQLYFSSFPEDCPASSLKSVLAKVCTKPSHCQDFDHLIVYFNQKCTHATAYETDTMKRLLDLSHAPRELLKHVGYEY